MAWSETGFSDDVQTPAETSDKKLDNSDSRTENLVHSTTDFLAKFDGEGNISSLVSDCIKEISANPELQAGFEKLLKSGISEDIINKIKQELQDGVEFGLDEITMKDSVRLIIKDAINGGFRVYSMNIIEGINQKTENEVQAENDVAKAENDVAKAVLNQEETEETRNLIEVQQENIIKALKEREQLLLGHDDVKEKTEKKAEIAQQHLPEETKNKLKEKGYSDKFINDYILLRVTLNEVKGNPDFDKNQVAQFEKGVNELSNLDVILKNIDNCCNIPDTNLNSFSSENITQTRHELFNSDIGNDNLINLKASNIGMRKRKNADGKSDYDRMFPEMTEEEMVQTYGKFLPNDFKDFLDKYMQHLNDNDLDEYRSDEKCQNGLNAIKNIKMSIDEKTMDLMEELCIISQIKGMYMCMGEGDDFDLNKANEIESENGVLTLNGHIDGVDFAIRQDTNNPEAKLQTSQKLVRSSDRNTFTIGGKNNFVDSNFILPSQNEVFNLAVESVNSNGALDDADTPAEYVKFMQERFMNKVDNMYEDTKYVHHYMKEQVKGEKIVDNSLKLIKQVKPSIENVFSNVNQTTNNDLYNFVRILNFNIENSTDYEKDKLNFCIDKIREVINNYRTEEKSSGLYSHDISNYLENDTWIDGKGNENQRLGLISGLFTHFNENPIDKSRVGYEGGGGLQTNMIINDLYIQLHDKPKEKEKQQNRDLVAEKERTDAEHELNSALGNMA